MMWKMWKETKSQYSEAEAATQLGMSIAELRSLIQNHIVKNDAELSNASIASFHPSDLLLLKILAGSNLAASRV